MNENKEPNRASNLGLLSFYFAYSALHFNVYQVLLYCLISFELFYQNGPLTEIKILHVNKFNGALFWANTVDKITSFLF